MRKLTALFITVAMVLSLSTVALSGARLEDYEYSEGASGGAGAVLTAYYGDGKDIDVPSSIGGKSVLVLEKTFSNNRNVESVKLPNGVVSISYDTFKGCTSLKSVVIPASVLTIGNSAFEGCEALESVEYDGTHYDFNKISIYPGNDMLTNADITYKGGEGEKIEYTCSLGEDNTCVITGRVGKSVSVEIPSTIENNTVTDFGRVFSGDRGIGCVAIPNTVKSIAYEAFNGCSSLKEVAIPSSVRSIDIGAFNSTAVTDIYYGGDEADWDGMTVGDFNDVLKNATVHFNSVEGHIVKEEATCTEGACCELCKDEIISPLGHKFVDAWAIDKAATTESTGEKSHHCTRAGCNERKDITVTDKIPFNDIKEGSWYEKSAAFVLENDLFEGVGEDEFAPNLPMSRGMLVVVFWRMSGKPKSSGKNPFTDVAEGKWYTEAILWAYENGIVDGTGGGKFSPNDSITREQMATLFYRFCVKYGYDTSMSNDITGFRDYGKVAAYAREAFAWANACGLINGTNKDGVVLLDPKGLATRAQVATILSRFCQNYNAIMAAGD